MVSFGLHSRKTHILMEEWKEAWIRGHNPANCASPLSWWGHSPSKSQWVPSIRQEVEGGQAEWLINQKSTDVSLLSHIPGVQKAKIPRFFLPVPVPSRSSPNMAKVTITIIYLIQPILSLWGKESSKVRWNQQEFAPPHTHMLIPGPQLVLTPPDEVAELLIVRVVVVLDSEQHGGWDLHQHVVGSLLLLATCVPIVQIVDLIRYLWGGGVQTQITGQQAKGGVETCLATREAYPWGGSRVWSTGADKP